MKRLIVCCDGTWNRADHVDEGKPAPTNVRRLYLAIDQETAPQRARYIEGVGTKRWEHIRGGALGFGLSRNVRDGYTFLVDNYEPGDELWFFGFSRGAFTARSLAGLVRNSGILKRQKRGMVKEAYKLYRSRKADDAPSERNARRFRDENSHPEAKIKFIGVWDTVGALGIPTGALRLPILTSRWSFHDTTLSRSVEHAYHAISIDEQRKPFTPTLWVQKVPPEEPPKGQKVRQVWFSGVHSDVGGGYADARLSGIALRWMADRACECGLVLTPGSEPTTAPDDWGGKKHDSMTWFYRRLLGGPVDRRLKTLEGTAIEDWLASSAKLRHEGDEKYRPEGLADWLRDRAKDVNELGW